MASISNISCLNDFDIDILLEEIDCDGNVGPGVAPFALDVGSGTGLLAMMAAACGASRVSTCLPQYIE